MGECHRLALLTLFIIKDSKKKVKHKIQKVFRHFAQTFYFNTLLCETVLYWRTLCNVPNFGIEGDPKFVEFAY